MNVELIQAAPGDRAALANLMQLYVHDFSEHWAGRAEGELGEDGRFPDYPLDVYWSEPTHVPLLIRVNGHLGGFALVNNASHLGCPVDRNMAEFFIVRKHRRSGAGILAAHGIFSRHPGQWEIAVARRNSAARAFWHKAIRNHPFAIDIDETDAAMPTWNGPVIRFLVRHPN